MEPYTDRNRMLKVIEESYAVALSDTHVKNKLVDVHTIFSGHIQDIDIQWHVRVENGNLTYHMGNSKQSQVHLIFPRAKVFDEIFMGEKDLVHYVKTSKVRFDGDSKLAKKLTCILKPFGVKYRQLMKTEGAK